MSDKLYDESKVRELSADLMPAVTKAVTTLGANIVLALLDAGYEKVPKGAFVITEDVQQYGVPKDKAAADWYREHNRTCFTEGVMSFSDYLAEQIKSLEGFTEEQKKTLVDVIENASQKLSTFRDEE